jgi:hypothetical protein
MPWYWFGGVIPFNVLFSFVFSYAIYRQYHMFASDPWKRLIKDDIQTMSLMVLCTIICGACVILKVSGELSELFFHVEW